MAKVNSQNLLLESAKGREKGKGGEGGNSNSKTLFYKDCSLGSIKNLTTGPC